jgi:hypothetical protein
MGSFPGLVEGLEPAHPVGNDVQQPLPGGHVVLVPRLDGFPGVPVGVGRGDAEGFRQPVRRLSAGDLFTTYEDSFTAVWEAAARSA